MIKRYSRKELTDIWEEKNKYKIWLDIELAATQGMEKIGLIPKGVTKTIKSKAKINKWIFNKDEVTNKDDIFMSSECTRNAIFKYLHQEIPYNIVVRNTLFKILNNNDIKIKQSIELKNMRYNGVF